jgi:DNA repair exonuclease SbcCD ATPase subunit
MKQKQEPSTRESSKTTDRSANIAPARTTLEPQEITARSERSERSERSYAQVAGEGGPQQGYVKSLRNQFNRNNESSTANSSKRVEQAPPPEDVIDRQRPKGHYESKRPSQGPDRDERYHDGSKQTSRKRTTHDATEEKVHQEIAELRSAIEKHEQNSAYWHKQYSALNVTYMELGAKYDTLIKAHEKLVGDVKHLEDDKEKLKDSKSQYREKVKRLEHAIEEERSASANRLQSYQDALEAEKAKSSKLTTEHIKSVNSVGTGLEPITDEEFIKSFRTLQDQVCNPIKHSMRAFTD